MSRKFIYARLKRKISDKVSPKLAPYRKKKITNKDFTIISNNCWAGNVYRYFGLPYLTPTVGLYFFAEDFIKFSSDLRYYVSCDLKIIKPRESKHYDKLLQRNELSVPIGKLDDVEIVFLHYKSAEEALTKWKRRVSRINWDNIIIKFSQMNFCNINHLTQFDNLKNVKKIMFVARSQKKYKSATYYKGYEKENEILNDTLYWNKYINIVDLINSPITKYH